MTPQITVIVPAYNASGTLQACLEAICARSGPEQEVLVVDDGSIDGTAAVARKAGAQVIEQKRQGPASARNAGARLAKGAILVFVDSDVIVHADAIAKMVESLNGDQRLAAVFGSYDARPGVRSVVARYRNLLHAYTHQMGAEEAATFWAGLGAVRREAFESIGGFDARRFEQASIEDIEFGIRLRTTGRRVRLDRAILGTHCKEWTLSSMVLTDLWCRAVPWTRLLRQTGKMPDDLNLRWGQRLSVAAVWVLPLALAAMALEPALGILPILIAAFHFALNARFFAWILGHAGPATAAAAVPLHLLFHWVAGLGYLIGSLTNSSAESAIAAPRGAART